MRCQALSFSLLFLLLVAPVAADIKVELDGGRLRVLDAGDRVLFTTEGVDSYKASPHLVAFVKIVEGDRSKIHVVDASGRLTYSKTGIDDYKVHDRARYVAFRAGERLLVVSGAGALLFEFSGVEDYTTGETQLTYVKNGKSHEVPIPG